MDIFRITKQGVELAEKSERPSHDLFVQLSEVEQLEEKVNNVIKWCRVNIEDQTLVSNFAMQIRNELER